jgi:hypothetical protein
MKRTVEHVERITYSIEEAEVRKLIRRHSGDLAGEDRIGPVFSDNTRLVRLEDGGYDVVTEYQVDKEGKALPR